MLLVVDSREKAEDLRQQILKGADFGALVRQQSKGGYEESGGDMGWIDPKVLPPPVTAAVETTHDKHDKAITPVVETPNRFFVVRVEGRQASRRLSLAEMKDHLTRTLPMERKRAKFTEWLDERRRTEEMKNLPLIIALVATESDAGRNQTHEYLSPLLCQSTLS